MSLVGDVRRGPRRRPRRPRAPRVTRAITDMEFRDKEVKGRKTTYKIAGKVFEEKPKPLETRTQRCTTVRPYRVQ